MAFERRGCSDLLNVENVSVTEEHMSTETVYEGGCLCGDIRYRATSEPEFVTHCHCQMCRKHSGALFATDAGFRAAILILAYRYGWGSGSRVAGRGCAGRLRAAREQAERMFHGTVADGG